MPKKPKLSVVRTTAPSGPSPPRKLGQHGLNLWNSVMSEYDISDCGGLELLAQACAAVDRAESLAECIAEDGEVLRTKSSVKTHPAVIVELQLRSFVVRTLQKLGVTTEAIQPVGRPNAGGVGWRGPA